MPHENQPKFPLGRLFATPGVIMSVPAPDFFAALLRHSMGDWGDVCQEDRAANDLALRKGTRLVSVYHSGDVKFYIITEWDRSLTTALLPSEY